jgi:hypothetical protein
MLLKYRTLLRHSEQRLNVGRWRLAQRQQAVDMEREQYQHLLNELELQRQLHQIGKIDGTEVSRQKLFSWLRRMSADRHRTQDLRLRLRRQEEAINDFVREVETQRGCCRQLAMRCDRYETLLKAAIKRRRLRQVEIDENEIEEHLSWFRS